MNFFPRKRINSNEEVPIAPQPIGEFPGYAADNASGNQRVTFLSPACRFYARDRSVVPNNC